MFLNVSVLCVTNVLIHELKLPHLIYFDELFEYFGSYMELSKDSEQKDYVIMPII